MAAPTNEFVNGTGVISATGEDAGLLLQTNKLLNRVTFGFRGAFASAVVAVRGHITGLGASAWFPLQGQIVQSGVIIANSTSISLVNSTNAALVFDTTNCDEVEVYAVSGTLTDFNVDAAQWVSGPNTTPLILYAANSETSFTSITASGTLAVDGASTLTGAVTTGAAVVPAVNDNGALGDATHGYSDLFLASGAVLNYANGNVAVTHSSGILTMGTGELRITTAGTNAASVITQGSTNTLTNKTFVAPVLGVATGTSLAVSGLLTSSSPTAGIGYATGAGGAQTQATDKSTTVVSNTITTAITMNNAALNAGVIVGFTFTNSTIAATDTVIVTHQSAGTSGAYVCNAFPGAGSAVISVRNTTAGNLSEAIVLRVTVIKSVSA